MSAIVLSYLTLGLILGNPSPARVLPHAAVPMLEGAWISEEFFFTTGHVAFGPSGDSYENIEQQCQGYYIGSLYDRPTTGPANTLGTVAIDVAKVMDDGFKVKWTWDGPGDPIPMTISNQSISYAFVLAGTSPPDNNDFPQGANSAVRGVTSSKVGSYGHSAVWYSPMEAPAVSTVVDEVVSTNNQITSKSNAHTVSLVRNPGSKFEAWAYFSWWKKTQ